MPELSGTQRAGLVYRQNLPVHADIDLWSHSSFERGGHRPRPGFQRFIRFPLADPNGKVVQVVSLVEFLMGHHEAQELLDAIDRNDK